MSQDRNTFYGRHGSTDHTDPYVPRPGANSGDRPPHLRKIASLATCVRGARAGASYALREEYKYMYNMHNCTCASTTRP